jgi:CheY-like chemotaxis protein
MSRILIVDDDKLMREAMAKAIADHGYQVIQAGNGEEAVALASTQTDRPDLIITDIVMPKMDGLQLLQHLRDSDWGNKIPVIVLTIKDADVSDVNASLQTGIVAYLSKADISPDQIIALIDQQFSASPQKSSEENN